MNGLIICATQRCGSTMIVEDMRNTSCLGVPEEYFIPWNPAKENIDWEKELIRIKERSSTANNFYSIKVMANQLPLIDECLKGTSFDIGNPTDEYEEFLFPRFRRAFSDCRFMMIRRDNLVRQAISRVISRQTGVNHATKEKDSTHFAGNLLKGYTPEYNKNSSYKHTDIAKEIVKISSENLLWESFFEANEVRMPLVLRYEEVCRNFPAYLERVSRYAEVHDDLVFKERQMVKLSNEVNDQWANLFLKEQMSL